MFSASLHVQSPEKKSGPDSILKNDKIKFETMRVIFKDTTTGTSSWQIMSRADALALAKSQDLDLVLGTYIIK